MTQTVIIECSNGKKLKRNRSNSSSIVMGKSHILSKEYPSAFATDCSHAVETVGETEGFNNSFRADSEDSHTQKRKCMNLNADQSNSFNVPVQFISPSTMSCPERKELEMKLTEDLERVRILQMKLQSRYPANTNQVSSRCYTKPTPIPPPVNLNAMVLKQCESLLKSLMQHKYSWVFKSPVDVVKLNIPDYFNIIKHPMDLGTIKKRLASGSYSNPMAFASDVRLTFTNAMTYNPPGNDVHIMADALNKIFEKKWKPIDQKLAAAAEVMKREKESAKSESSSMPKNRKASTENGVTISIDNKPKMSFVEKQKLSNRLQSQIDEMPNHIIEFLRQKTNNDKSNEDEIEIDIESLDDETLFELQRLLDDYFDRKQPALPEKVEHCEMEILAESGVSNSPVQPPQVNEPADEDIDIGGDDPPISSFPAVELEKDTAPSSSSESGSSSSDSDSGSSSESDSDEKVAASTKYSKENEQSVVTKHPETDVTMAPLDTNREHSVFERENSASLEVNGSGQVGEYPKSEQQVSPNKLYRAAQLRNRFADTIFKAREKTLNQSEKKDFEKLQREREEFERQKKEEKARLAKEAKVAEEAQRLAEAEAAKKRRELEREAARQALLQMEKTVEINEGNLVLEDLEILGTARDEHVQSAVNEISPDQLGFNIGGSNPLEQLGLFRKDDDEEEDECGVSGVPSNNMDDG